MGEEYISLFLIGQILLCFWLIKAYEICTVLKSFMGCVQQIVDVEFIQ